MCALFLITPKKMILTILFWVWLETVIVPDGALLVFLLGSIAVRLLSGILKSALTGIKEPKVLRRTGIYMGIYFCVIATVWLAANMIARAFPQLNYARPLNITIAAITGIEVYLTLKNVYEIDPHGPLSKWVVRPIMRAVGSGLDRAAKYFKGYEKDNSESGSPDAPHAED